MNLLGLRIDYLSAAATLQVEGRLTVFEILSVFGFLAAVNVGVRYMEFLDEFFAANGIKSCPHDAARTAFAGDRIRIKSPRERRR